MTDKIKRGREGENLAAEFLKKKGYHIVARNYRYKRSEIDLIVRSDDLLVFAEVKTRSSHTFGYPEEFVDDRKAEKVLEGAEQFIAENNWPGSVRYDIISVSVNHEKVDIVHFEDAFY